MKLIVQPEAGLVPVVQAIRNARRAIDIAIFRLNRTEIESALAGAVQRGVRVRALVAHTNRGGENQLRKLEQRLLAAGVTVSRSGDDLLKYHGKYLIIDDILHLLGFNYTKADTVRSRSFGVQTRNHRAVKDAQLLFECDLSKRPYEGGSHRSPLVVSPENAREALTSFVAGAKKRLAIYDGRLDDRAFSELLRERAAAGVVVQVIGKAPRLESGTQVRPLADLRLHVRTIVRDGTHAFVGSQSLRRLELESRREVGLIVTNPSVSRRLLEVFDKDWDASAPKHLKDEDHEEDADVDRRDERASAHETGKPRGARRGTSVRAESGGRRAPRRGAAA